MFNIDRKPLNKCIILKFKNVLSHLTVTRLVSFFMYIFFLYILRISSIHPKKKKKTIKDQFVKA